MNVRLLPKRKALVLLSLFGVFVLLLGWLSYRPGISGPFLFDDFGSLPLLGDYGPIHSFWKAVAWVTSGFSGPTGRPISLASFLIDARTWPAVPELFKLTNIWIHLVNGVVLAGLATALLRGFGLGREKALWGGVLAASIWLLHPFWVSTTLYVIQRMSMLAALFVFAGLWAYAHGRLQLQAGRRRSAYIWMSLGLVLGVILATFSKENGALLPLFAWLIEGFVYDRDGRALEHHGTGFIWWRRVFIILPSLVLLGYLLWLLPILFSSQTFGRDFTPVQRLMTETRIVWGYLAALWLPGTHMGGLFHDDIRLSYSLLRPVSTLFATLGLFGLAAFAYFSRVYSRSVLWRSVGLAVAFFLIGHVLESTWLPLELSFEHRNYLPAGLMFLPLAVLLVDRFSLHRSAVIWSVIVLMCGLALMTWKRADLWGKPFQQALVWAHEHPNSPRAQGYLANFWSGVGNYPEAERLLDQSLKKHPGDLLLVANRVMVACATDSVPTWLRQSLVTLAQGGPIASNVTSHQFDKLLQSIAQGCGQLSGPFELRLIDMALTNSHLQGYPTERRSLLHRRALYWLAVGQPNQAYGDYIAALRLPKLLPGARLRFAAELGTAHQPKLALQLLNAVPSPLAHIHGWSMPAIHQRWLRHVGFYRESEQYMRKQLLKEVGTETKSQ